MNKKDRERSSLLQKRGMAYKIASDKKHPSKNTRSYRRGVWHIRSRAQLAPTEDVLDYTVRLMKIASDKKSAETPKQRPPAKTLAPTEEG